MKIEDKFNVLVELAWYAIQWYEDLEDDSYTTGCVETVAHQIACAINQWYGPFKNGVPTCETRDYLELDCGISREELYVLLMRYIALLQEEND